MELQHHYLLDIQSSAIRLTIYLPGCEILVIMSKYTSSSVNLFTNMLSQSCLNKYTYRRDLPDMDIYFHVHGVGCVLPFIKDSAK